MYNLKAFEGKKQNRQDKMKYVLTYRKNTTQLQSKKRLEKRLEKKKSVCI
jgi:hypothetical protein